MPKRTDISSILVLGSGPIVIGQACEFDYSGTQACRVLRREGYRVILVNSNPATIMTDPEFADATYVEPLVPEIVEKILERERPDALLPTVGGQTGINLAIALDERGALERFGVEVLGAGIDALRLGEDRAPLQAGDGGDRPPGRRRAATPARSTRRARSRGDRLPGHRPPDASPSAARAAAPAYNRDELDEIVGGRARGDARSHACWSSSRCSAGRSSSSR